VLSVAEENPEERALKTLPFSPKPPLGVSVNIEGPEITVKEEKEMYPAGMMLGSGSFAALVAFKKDSGESGVASVRVTLRGVPGNNRYGGESITAGPRREESGTLKVIEGGATLRDEAEKLEGPV